MASLLISYYSSAQNGCASDPQFSETLTTSGSSTQGSVNTRGAEICSLFSTAAHYVSTGVDPTASAETGAYVPANVLFWLDLNGVDKRVAAVTA